MKSFWLNILFLTWSVVCFGQAPLALPKVNVNLNPQSDSKQTDRTHSTKQPRIEHQPTEARINELLLRIETERLRADTQKKQFKQQARTDALDYATAQQYLIRGFLVAILIMLLVFAYIYYRKSEFIYQQSREIVRLKRSLEYATEQRNLDLKELNEKMQFKNPVPDEIQMQNERTERRRMAADLYDTLGGLLVAIRGTLTVVDPAYFSDRERVIYQNLLDMTNGASAEVRYMPHHIQPDELEKQGLPEALRLLVEKLNLTQRITFYLDKAELPPLEKNTAFNVYSICIELSSNIIQHSEATEAHILFRQYGDELNMIVKDNGRGMNPAKDKGLGLRHVQARTRSIRGHYEVHSEAGAGTTFIFILPVSSDMAAT